MVNEDPHARRGLIRSKLTNADDLKSMMKAAEYEALRLRAARSSTAHRGTRGEERSAGTEPDPSPGTRPEQRNAGQPEEPRTASSTAQRSRSDDMAEMLKGDVERGLR